MEKNLIIQPEKCTGCRTCEMVCSFVHTGEFNPLRSRVTVFNFDKVGMAAPIVCQQCSISACMEVCPVGAISRDDNTGAMMVAHEKCLKCKMCSMACPFGATTYDPVSDIMMKCDLCGGDPQCADYCSSGAISYQDPMQANLARRRNLATKLQSVYEEVI